MACSVLFVNERPRFFVPRGEGCVFYTDALPWQALLETFSTARPTGASISFSPPDSLGRRPGSALCVPWAQEVDRMIASSHNGVESLPDCNVLPRTSTPAKSSLPLNPHREGCVFCTWLAATQASGGLFCFPHPLRRLRRQTARCRTSICQVFLPFRRRKNRPYKAFRQSRVRSGSA
jgi:hypothetical protein